VTCGSHAGEERIPVFWNVTQCSLVDLAASIFSFLYLAAGGRMFFLNNGTYLPSYMASEDRKQLP
jgi:hypothetical protein